MTTTKTDLLTADDLLRLDAEGIRGELIRGVLHETMHTGEEHGIVASLITYHLLSHVLPRRLGVVVGTDSGVLLERDPDTVREPDVAYTSYERRGTGPRSKTHAEAVPDLVAEVVSPNDKPPDVLAKAEMWLSFGVRLVWVVRPQSRTVDVHRPGEPVITLDDTQSLDGLDVLPGFACPLTDIFDD